MSLLTAHPLVPGRAEKYRRWCTELRGRREEFGASRWAAGVDRMAVWSQPRIGLAVVRVDAPEPLDALRHLDESGSAFDRWYRGWELELHGVSLLSAATEAPELVADHHLAPVDPFDPYMAMAVPLLPGHRDRFRDTMRRGVESGDGPEHARSWGVNRLTVHVQQVGDGAVALYEVSGDLPRMVRELAGDDTPAMRTERWLFREHFGIDLAAGELPVPEPAFAWSAQHGASRPLLDPPG